MVRILGASVVILLFAVPEIRAQGQQEQAARPTTQCRPEYPNSLKTTNIDGNVLIQFVVDTVGSVEMQTVKVLKSSDDAFAVATRAALAHCRFTPARVAGRAVRELVRMPFIFACIDEHDRVRRCRAYSSTADRVHKDGALLVRWPLAV